MSTAIAEPPVAEKPNKEAVVEVPEVFKEVLKEDPKKETKPSSFTDDVRIVLPGQEQQKEPVKDEPRAEDKKDAAVVETAKEPEAPKMSPNARQAFAKIEKERDEAIQKVGTFETELKTLKSQSQNVEQLSKRAEEAEKRSAELLTQLRSVSLERDPEFIGRYEKPRESRLAELVKLAKAAGIEEDADRIFRSGDQDKIDEIRETLPAGKRAAFDAHMTAIANLDFERQEALKDSDKTSKNFEEIRIKQMQEEASKYTQQNVQVADAVVERILDLVPPLKEDPELRAELKSISHAVAGATEESSFWTTDNIMMGVLMSKVQHKMLNNLNSVNEDQRKQIADRDKIIEDKDKQIEERDAFIKNRAGGYPRSDHTNGNTPKEEKLTGAVSDIRVRLPDGRFI